MNYKSLIITALVLVAVLAVPVSAAVWSAGNYVQDEKFKDCDSVQYNPKSDVYSCYRDINPVKEIAASNEGNGGVAVGSIRVGYPTLSPTIYVRNVLQPENSSSMVIPVNQDGTFRIPEPDKGVLAPGEYTATLDNFNLPDETVHFTIAAGQQGPTLIGDLNGQAVSSISPKVVSQKPKPKVTICTATYYPDLSKRPISGHVALNWRNHFGVANVKGAVTALVNSGNNPFVVSNGNLGGDPAYGWYKKLTVSYVIGDDKCSHFRDIKVETADEGEQINLD